MKPWHLQDNLFRIYYHCFEPLILILKSNNGLLIQKYQGTIDRNRGSFKADLFIYACRIDHSIFPC